MNGRVDHPVWYDGRKFDNVTAASVELNVSVNKLYKAISCGYLNGIEITRTPPEIRHVIKKRVHIHVPGEPLIPHPVTCQISSLWNG